MTVEKKFRLAELDGAAREVFQTLEKENDMAGVVVATALLDAYLGALLAKIFREGRSADRLLAPSGALGGFANRAALAYCLQLLPLDLYRDVESIGKVRNLFAHSPFRLSFENSEVQKVCAQLSAWKFLEELWPSARPSGQSADMATFEAKMRFNGSVVMLANNLVLTTALIEPLSTEAKPLIET